MSVIYIVTSGCYSDYGICGVFSTREKAQEYLATVEVEDKWVEEHEIDAGLSAPERGLKSYTVEFEYPDTSDVWGVYEMDHPGSIGIHRRWTGRANVTGILARDREHAIKIASERRAAWIAAGEPE